METAYACLEVKDTGQGIPEKQIGNIFDPFFSTKVKGRGLGLPVVLGIMQEHNGAISVESPPAKGTIFRLFFPLQANKK